MTAARKPVIVRKLTRDWYAGYAAALPPEDDSPDLELLESSGKLLRISWNEIKWVCYIRDLAGNPGTGLFSRSDTADPERLLRRRFTSRPRTAGIWLRLTLVDGEELEGIAANDRSLIDATGLLLTPPDTRSNTQRVFVPRGAIRDLTILAVIAPSTPHPQKPGQQPQLFEKEPDDD